MIGRTISHYEIIEQLGEGGMGVVYKAHDTKLDRTVALKFLPPHLTKSEEDKQRFIREAKAAAALNHPHICTVYSVEDHDDSQFISMEYIDGVTLRQSSGLSAEASADKQTSAPGKHGTWNLELGIAIGYCLQIAEALAEAHDKGIVHRDIKPDNIMVDSKNRIKVMDFGLAKLKTAQALTKSRSTAGTLAYMSPEQVQGTEIDHRSDIFSFAVLLYEMITGKLPFPGEHEAALVYSIVNEDHTPLDRFIDDPPQDLIYLIDRALEKDPDDRIQTMHDFIGGLRRLKKKTSGTRQAYVPDTVPDTDRSKTESAKPQPAGKEQTKKHTTTVSFTIPSFKNYSIIVAVGILFLLLLGGIIYFVSDPEVIPQARLSVAVADFENETAERELDGLSGMLITSLEQSERLAVFPRSRMFDELALMGMDDVEVIDEPVARQVARHAGLDALVEASIRKFGNVYTIDLKIMDPDRAEYIFTANEEGEGQESVPRMLDRLSERIRTDFRGERIERAPEQRQVEDMITSNLQAYHHYYLGEQHISKLRFEEAIEELQQAVELDPEFGLAWFQLYYALNWQFREGAGEALDNAVTYIDRVPDKYRLLIAAKQAEDREGRIEYYKRVLEKFPEEKDVVFQVGDNYFHLGDLHESEPYLLRTLELDPTYLPALQHTVWLYWNLGEFDKMEFYSAQYIEHADNHESYRLYSLAKLFNDKPDEALEIAREASELHPRDPEMRALPAEVNLYVMEFDEVRRILDDMIADDRNREMRSVGYRWLTSYYLMQGRYRDALDALDAVYEIDDEQDDKTLQVLYHTKRAFIFAFEGYDRRAARDELRIVNDLSEYHTFISRFFLGGALIALGEYNDGADAFPDGVPDLDLLQKAFNQLQNNEMEDAINSFQYLMDRGHRWFSLVPNYMLNVSIIIGDTRRARYAGNYIEQARSPEHIAVLGYYDLMYPHSLYRLGVMHHEAGEIQEATKYFREFLSLWNDADPDLPQPADARRRLNEIVS